MTLTFFGRKRPVVVSVEERLGRLRKVLSRAGIAYDRRDPESALRSLTPVPGKSATRLITREPLHFPIETSQQIAVFSSCFDVQSPARVFNCVDPEALKTYAPHGAVANLGTLRELAHGPERVEMRDAIVVLARIAGTALPTSADRDELWKVFGTPIFEYLQSWDGTVLARECQVHDGLHLAEENAVFELVDGEGLITQLNRLDTPVIRAQTGLAAEVWKGHCECGLESPRLFDLTPIEQEQRVEEAA